MQKIIIRILLLQGYICGIGAGSALASGISDKVMATGRATISKKLVSKYDEKDARKRAALYSRVYGEGWRDRRKRLARERVKLLMKQDGEIVNNYEKRVAVYNARIAALKKYVNNLEKNEDTKALYDTIATHDLMPIFLESIDTYVPDYRILKEGRENGLLTATIAAEINSSKIRELIKKATESGARQTEDSELVFIIVAREVSSVDETHAIKNTLAKGSASKSETADIDEDTGAAGHSAEYIKKSKSTAYNTKVQERLTYRYYNISDIQSRILKSFSQSDFEVLKGQDLLDGMEEDELEKIEGDEDFMVSLGKAYAGDIGFNKKLRPLKKFAKSCELKWFGISKMTVGRAGVDSDTGLVVVEVTLNVDIARLVTKKMGKRIRVNYKTIASNIQTFKGIGQDPATAKTNGLLRAGVAATKGIVNQMRNKLSRK